MSDGARFDPSHRPLHDPHLDLFNGQNALMGLQIDDIADRRLERLRWEVSFDAAYGLEAAFLCARITVVAAEPCTPAGHLPRPHGTRSPPRPAP